MALELNEEFVTKIANEAVQKQLEISIRNNVREIVGSLIHELFGGFMGGRMKYKRGKDSKRVTDLRRFIKAQLEETMVAWVQEVMSEEVGGDLVKYVMENVRFDEDEDEDEEY